MNKVTNSLPPTQNKDIRQGDLFKRKDTGAIYMLIFADLYFLVNLEAGHWFTTGRSEISEVDFSDFDHLGDMEIEIKPKKN